jgi:hypothetical protein
MNIARRVSPGVSKGAAGDAKEKPSSKKQVVIPGLTRNPDS